MRRIAQLSFLVVAMILFFGGPDRAKAQRYSVANNGFGGDNLYQPRFKVRRYLPRKVRRRSKSVSIGRSRRKAKRNRRRILRKRKVAALAPAIVRRKKQKNKTPRVAKAVKIAKPAKGPVQIVVSLPRQRVSIYQGGRVVATSRISTGKAGHRTPSGVFSIIQKSRTHFSNLYSSAPMPYMQRITWSGLALHAGNVSRPYASHGCIRLPYGFAKKLFRRTSMGAHVIVASGSSPLMPIKHMSLIQPLPKGNLVSSGVRTASAGELDSVVGTEGIPGFVRPVVLARKKLKEREVELERAIAVAPEFVEAYEKAQNRYDEAKKALVTAKKVAFAQRKLLRKPRYAVKKLGRVRRMKLRSLKKAERAAKLSRSLIEKRQGNPRYEGKWMTGALLRLQGRDELVARRKAVFEDAQQQYEMAVANLEAIKQASQKANEVAAARAIDVRGAALASKKARAKLLSSKRAVQLARKAVKSAHAAIKSAIAREKMPLRILITPRVGQQRIKDTQKLLAELGYDPGVADGAVGAKTRMAIKAFQREMNLKETGQISDALIDSLYQRAGRTQKATAHMYVRQGFKDLFDVPVGVKNPEKPIGTHVFTAMQFDSQATSTQWTALTVKDAVRKNTKRRKGRRGRKREGRVNVTALQALDRIEIPDAVRRQLSRLLTPGSSIVVSDRGISHETGKGTDFVVLTR